MSGFAGLYVDHGAYNLKGVEFHPLFPGQGFNHTIYLSADRNKRYSIPCPCKKEIHCVIANAGGNFEKVATVITCDHCESWHSVLWISPKIKVRSPFTIC